MNKNQNTLLTTSQFTLTIVALILSIDIMSSPNNVIPISRQDAWISCLLGAIYPLYVVFLANYMCNKFPNDNILVISKKYFGFFLGSILNIIFVLFFLFITTTEITEYSNIFRTYAVQYLRNFQVMLITLLPTAYLAYKGMKPLGRLNELCFYLTIGLFFVPLAIIPYGHTYNLMPVFQSGVTKILLGTKTTIYSFCGMEIIFLIYPFLMDKKKLLKCGLISTLIISTIYTLSTFATIYYLGIETSVKFFWPVLALADSINIPVINSFRYIFISFWSIIAFKCMSTSYFATTYGLSQSIKKISSEDFVLILFPIIIFLALLYGNPTKTFYYINLISSIYVPFNIIYISILCILIHFKKGDSYETT